MTNDVQPRQGIIFPGMGPTRFADVAKFMALNPIARRLVTEADRRLRYGLLDRYRASDGDYSHAAQVAFFVNSVALAEWAVQEYGLAPEACAGPSFGGKAAAVFAGALDFADGVWLTAEIARCLDEYFTTEHTGLLTQSFARTPPDRLAEITAELDELGEWWEVSCEVDHDFAMLTLHVSRLEWLQRRLRAAGGMPLYTMAPPMHCSIFTGLAAKVADEVLDELDFADPRLPVIADQDGGVRTTADGIRQMLLDGFVRPVRWPRVVAGLRDLGVGEVHVCGQDALFGRVPCTTSAFQVTAVDPRLVMRPRIRAVPV